MDIYLKEEQKGTLGGKVNVVNLFGGDGYTSVYIYLEIAEPLKKITSFAHI